MSFMSLANFLNTQNTVIWTFESANFNNCLSSQNVFNRLIILFIGTVFSCFFASLVIFDQVPEIVTFTLLYGGPFMFLYLPEFFSGMLLLENSLIFGILLYDWFGIPAAVQDELFPITEQDLLEYSTPWPGITTPFNLAGGTCNISSPG